MTRGESGSASIAVVGGAMLVLVVGLLVVDVGVYAGARARAVGAADAAALAAAPVTFRDFGAGGGPGVEAGRFAAANGVTLLRCDCRFDPTWAPRTVEIAVTLRVSLLLLGDRTVTVTSRAEFIPAATVIGSQTSPPTEY